jgi:putative intracellular protease/amidase
MTSQHTTQHTPRRRSRRLLWATGTLLLTVATFASVVFAGAVATDRNLHQAVPTTSAHGSRTAYTEPAHPAGTVTVHHGRRLVVAFVVGKAGTIASDLLAPYDIFASSPAFITYVVADGTGPAPLEGGPAVVPTYTFTDVDTDPTLTPDLVVVPGLTKPTGSSERTLREWVTRQHDDGAKILSVCSGALVLAPTGMLDGLHATSHWSRIHALENSRPAVYWERGRRWVEDGTVTTTAAVTSGVPAALHLVAELAGPAEAQRVADLHPELGWTPTETTTIPDDHFAASDSPVGLNYVFPWFRPTVGVALNDGVGELDATAAFEVYGQSAAARTVAIAIGDTVRTRHGLTLLTTRISKAPHLSWLVVPGAADLVAVDPSLRAWANSSGLTVEPLADLPGVDESTGDGGFTTALQNLADHTDAATARTTAKMMGYPTPDLNRHAGHRSWRTILLGLASLALAVVIGRAPAQLSRRRRRRSHTPANTPGSASGSTPGNTPGNTPAATEATVDVSA